MATKIYLGNPPEHIKKWIKENYKPKKNVPLHFTANEPNSSVSLMVNDGSESWCEFEYSTDEMKTWNDYDGHIVYLDNCENKTMYIQAKYGDTEDNPNRNGLYDGNCHQFVMEGSIKAGGNIQFLLDNTGSRMDVPYGCYYGMFSGCTSLTQAPELPATTLAASCYSYMFSGCTSLTQAPELSATTLADNCYYGMFLDCTALTQAPALPATTLCNWCYSSMFQNCTSLTQTPELPATELAYGCYGNMFIYCTSLTKIVILAAKKYGMEYIFNGCSNLSYIEVNFTEWSNELPWHYNNLAPTGTFVCPEGLPELYGANYIPEGWTVVRK